MQQKNTKSKKSGPKASATSKLAEVKNVCVYCGSNPGNNPAYMEAARTLGADLAKSGIGLVYGGGGRGMMGETARSVLAGGGRVTGIIPSFLSEKEQMLRDVTDLVVVNDMHQRKMMMFERSDAFVALPGGIGTLEELVEQLTWAQLGRHRKPVVIANIAGCWEPFLSLIRHMQAEGFIRKEMDVTFIVANTAAEIVPAILKAAQPTSKEAAETVTEKF